MPLERRRIVLTWDHLVDIEPGLRVLEGRVGGCTDSMTRTMTIVRCARSCMMWMTRRSPAISTPSLVYYVGPDAARQGEG